MNYLFIWYRWNKTSARRRAFSRGWWTCWWTAPSSPSHRFFFFFFITLGLELSDTKSTSLKHRLRAPRHKCDELLKNEGYAPLRNLSEAGYGPLYNLLETGYWSALLQTSCMRQRCRRGTRQVPGHKGQELACAVFPPQLWALHPQSKPQWAG